MDEWLPRACEYVASWLEFQMRLSRQPGCIALVTAFPEEILEREPRGGQNKQRVFPLFSAVSPDARLNYGP